MNKNIKTRQQLIERLNEIDRKCIDNNKHFHDLKTLYEAKEYKLSAKDKADIKKVAAIEDDPDTLKAYIDSKAIEEDYNEFDDSPWEFIERKDVLDFDGFWTDYTLWHNLEDDKWVCIFGDRDLYRPEDSEPDAEFDSEWEAKEWFEDYSTEDYDDEDLELTTDDRNAGYWFESLDDSSDNFPMEYKGYDIEYNFYKMNEYTVQYCGDDIVFNSLEKAKKFIDDITKEESLNETILSPGDEYDYYNVYCDGELLDEFPTFEEAFKAAKECGEGGCDCNIIVINGVTQYGAGGFEETKLNEYSRIEELKEDLNDTFSKVFKIDLSIEYDFITGDEKDIEEFKEYELDSLLYDVRDELKTYLEYKKICNETPVDIEILQDGDYNMYMYLETKYEEEVSIVEKEIDKYISAFYMESIKDYSIRVAVYLNVERVSVYNEN